MDEYVSDPKAAFGRGKVPEMGERGGIRYRTSSSTKPLKQNIVFIDEIEDIGIFEINGQYKAYIHKDDKNHEVVVAVMKDILSDGGTIFDAIDGAKNIYKNKDD